MRARNRGEFYIPSFDNPDISFTSLALIPGLNRMTAHFRFNTPYGQIQVNVSELDTRFINLYQAGDILGYFSSVRTRESEVFQLFSKEVTVFNPLTYEYTGFEIPYILVDETDFPAPLALNLFVINDFQIAISTQSPRAIDFFNDVVFNITPVTHRPISATNRPFSANHTIRFAIGDNIYTIDGVPALLNGRVFVPIRYVVEVLGASIYWDGEARAVYIHH